MNLLLGSYHTAKKLVIGIIGFTVLFFGLLLIFLPGPAFIVIPVGIIILATEFVWARHLLKRLRERFPDHVTRKWPFSDWFYS